jgi:hypothetical protein
MGLYRFEKNPTKDNKKREFFLFLNLDFPCCFEKLFAFTP